MTLKSVSLCSQRRVNCVTSLNLTDSQHLQIPHKVCMCVHASMCKCRWMCASKGMDNFDYTWLFLSWKHMTHFHATGKVCDGWIIKGSALSSDNAMYFRLKKNVWFYSLSSLQKLRILLPFSSVQQYRFTELWKLLFKILPGSFILY